MPTLVQYAFALRTITDVTAAVISGTAVKDVGLDVRVIFWCSKLRRTVLVLLSELHFVSNYEQDTDYMAFRLNF